MLKSFVIPIKKDDLLMSCAGQYTVEEVLPIRMISQSLEATKKALQTNGASFILNNFDTFFSVIVHGNKIDLHVHLLAFKRIIKGVEMLVENMEKTYDKDKAIEENERLELLCINKMLAYLFSSFMCHINERIINDSNNQHDIGKRKKGTKTDIEEKWDDIKQNALELLYRWLQLPLQKIWKPPIVEDMFISTLSQVCYKILEQSRDSKEKHMRQTIFEILGVFIMKYNHGIISVVRMIQLVKLYDTLAIPIATGIVHMNTNCGCTGLLKEIVKEICQSEPTEAESRNISIFLEQVATLQPDVIIPVLDDILEYLANEYYSMRNCAIGIVGIVISKILTGDNLTKEQKQQRDECLDNLEDHILDCHAYVRSKVLQTWQNLCCEGAVPLKRQVKLLTATALRLQDRSANTRKQALQLLRTLLQSNPFAAELNRADLSNSLETETAKLNNLQAQFVTSSVRGDNERLEVWNNLLPDIRKAIEKIIQVDSEDEDPDDAQDLQNENIDPNYAFENVRQLLLNKKVNKAVSYLWKVCTKLEDAPKMNNLSLHAKEECLFVFLLKIFMESESVSLDTEDDGEKEKQLGQGKTERDVIMAQKGLVNYLKNCLEFATQIESAIPLAENLLFSATVGDAVEACTLLGVASQFGIAGSTVAIQKALLQIFHRDQSVRNNVAVVYKQLYLDINESQRSSRQRAITCAQNLIDLVKQLQPSQSPALSQIIMMWYKNEELNSETLQVLWEHFSMKSPNATLLDSRAAIMLITMMAQVENEIITENLDTLIKVGLNSKTKTDLLLARDTCRALLKIKQDNKNFEKPPIQYSNDHDIFKEIITLLVNNFTNVEKDGYISFVTDAINVIYHLADQPDNLMKHVLVNILSKGNFLNNELDQLPLVSSLLLSKLLYLIGHIAIRQMVHLDTSVYRELKRRNTLRDLKKGAKHNNKQLSRAASVSSIRSGAGWTPRNMTNMPEDNGEDALEGATDDADAEFINSTLENEIITGHGLLAKFVPIVLDVCQHPEKYNIEYLQAAATLALSKMMTVSSTFCEESLQLLITILERSSYPEIRANVLIGLSDLTTRFPNQVEPWTKHIYGRLRDENINVRSTCVRVLSNLIMREMIRIKGQVSELALCIVDKDIQIQQDTKKFFKELSQKGNALYNVIPDILSRLADPELNLNENNFQEIVSFILSLMEKEKQVDTIIKNICVRFKLATTERQWRDLSYCLSLFQFNTKSIQYIIEALPFLKDKIHHKEVMKALQNIIERSIKKPEAKAAAMELEEKIQELVQSANSDLTNNKIMPSPSISQPKVHRKVTRKSSSDEDDSDNNIEYQTPHLRSSQKNKRLQRSKETSTPTSYSESNSEYTLSLRRSTRTSIRRKIAKPNVTPSSIHKKSKLNRAY